MTTNLVILGLTALKQKILGYFGNSIMKMYEPDP